MEGIFFNTSLAEPLAALISCSTLYIFLSMENSTAFCLSADITTSFRLVAELERAKVA